MEVTNVEVDLVVEIGWEVGIVIGGEVGFVIEVFIGGLMMRAFTMEAGG